MDTRSIETKHIINKGFKQENLKNPFIYEMANKNHFKLGDGDLTFMGVAFYIAPFVNAMVRSGTQEEKELLFNSMLKFKAFDKIPSTKRGHKPGEIERVVDQALRTVTNVKNRQTRAQDAGLEFLENMIEEQNLLEHKVLLFLLEPGQVDRNIAGLIANKFMAKYQRPCCILTKVTEEIEKGKTKVSYQGSARGYDKGGVDNFKDICAAAPGVIFATGHQSAFGLGIECGYLEEEHGAEVYGESILQFIEYTDEVLKDMNSEPTYYVDYIFNENNVNANTIIEIAEMDNIWSSSVDEPLVAVQNIKITKGMLNFYKENTIKISLSNNISLMLFNTNRETYEKLYSEDGFIEINAVCRCNKNEWNGNVSAQLFIEDYEIIDSCAYIF
jgi:single-stranded-DNA-specific exonuclease